MNIPEIDTSSLKKASFGTVAALALLIAFAAFSQDQWLFAAVFTVIGMVALALREALNASE